jgi:hypothetical protein
MSSIQETAAAAEEIDKSADHRFVHAVCRKRLRERPLAQKSDIDPPARFCRLLDRPHGGLHV